MIANRCHDICLTRSLHLFLELWDSPTDEEHVQTYLWLGWSYKQRGRTRDIRACYEMGLLIALHAKNLHSKSSIKPVEHFKFYIDQEVAKYIKLVCVGSHSRSSASTLSAS